MKFKTEKSKTSDKVGKLTTVVISLLIVTTGIFTLYSASILDYKKIIKMLLDKIYFAIPIDEIPASARQNLNYVAQENVVMDVKSQTTDKLKSLGSSFNQSYENKKKNLSDEKLLYRKRRYLQFPEGSSLQLVFNVLLPIIDYTNYAILGITCALAYELPSKPLSELEDELIKKLNKETVGYSTNHSAIDPSKYIDTHHLQNHIKDTFSNLIYTHPSEFEYQNSYHSPSEFYLNGNKNYIPGPYSPGYNQKPPIYSYYESNNNHYNNLKNSKYDSGKLFESFWKQINNKSPYIRRHDEIPKRKEPAVYHIMGKRSIHGLKPSPVPDDANTFWLRKLDQIHLQYHRSSRHELYSKLETMLDRQGKNGTECILRALCETGNRRHDTEPDDLVTEVFRAVFTLPQDLALESENPLHRARDDAHWNQQNCSEAYPLCENFIWDGNFRI